MSPLRVCFALVLFGTVSRHAIGAELAAPSERTIAAVLTAPGNEQTLGAPSAQGGVVEWGNLHVPADLCPSFVMAPPARITAQVSRPMVRLSSGAKLHRTPFPPPNTGFVALSAGPYDGFGLYYFYFAHRYAAQAIGLLPEDLRARERERLLEKLLRTRDPDGTWNDRVFLRSGNYGTSMAVIILLGDRFPQPPSNGH